MRPFTALVAAQAAHSLEEYVGRLWESFPPATFLTGLVSPDQEVGFIVINSALVLFGVWCLVWPVRRNWPSAAALAWFWVVLETVNGIGHVGWSLAQQAYTPGVLTAPLLLVFALFLASDARTAAASQLLSRSQVADPRARPRQPRGWYRRRRRDPGR